MATQIPALLISGPPASGKSTLAAAVAARLRAALLDQDVLTGALTGVIGELVGTHDLDDPALGRLTRDARYEAVIAGAVGNLRIGTPVVLVAPFTAERTDPAAWHAVRDRLSDAGGRPALVWLRLPANELVRRLRARGAERDRGKLADPAAFAGAELLRPPVVEHLAVDATAGTAHQLEDIFSRLP
jgi:predicted kinase